MYLSKKIGDACFSVNDDGGKIEFTAENFSEPLRGYLIAGEKTLYAGLSKPSGNGSDLLFNYLCKPEKFIVTRGRLEDNHDIVCEFVFDKLESCGDFGKTVKYIFSHPAACDCVKYYGHFFIFEHDDKKVFALPSEFEMHPLLHLIPFAWWYSINLDMPHTGYYLIGVSDDNKPFFVDEKLLTELIGNSKMEKLE